MINAIWTRRALRCMTVVIAMALALFLVVTLPAQAAAVTPYPSGSTGVDVSWPNCSATPPTHPAFGIVGVTDGTGYSKSPCLAQEAAWFSNLSLYVNTGWNNQSSYINPTSPKVCATRDNNCLACASSTHKTGYLAR